LAQDDNERIVRMLYEAWNDRDFDRAAALIADDGEILLVGSGTRFRGPDGAREYNQMWADAFPDGRIRIDNVIAQGDRVAIEFTGTGTHTGTLRSPGGEIPPTGRSVTLQLCDVYELRDGKVRSMRDYLDTAALLTQLGVMEAPTRVTA
jgi:steroid delta-isomerase-like uncharacterized protein